MHAEGLSAALPLHRVLTLGKIAEGWGGNQSCYCVLGYRGALRGGEGGGCSPHDAFSLWVGAVPRWGLQNLFDLAEHTAKRSPSLSLSLSAKSDLILNAKGGGKGQEGTWAGWHRKGYRTEY